MHKPKLAIDTTFLWDQYTFRGIGRYGREIVPRLLKQNITNPNWDVVIVGYQNLETTLEKLKIEKPVGLNWEFISLGEPKLSSPVSNLKEYRSQLLPQIKKINPDVYLAIHFEKPLPSKTIPTIAVVHDIIPMAINTYSKRSPLHNLLKGLYYKKVMWPRVQNARKLLTPSEISKNDLLGIGGIPADKIEKIYLGISDIFMDPTLTNSKEKKLEIAEKFGLLDQITGEIRPYLLYDAGFEGNKNTAQLAEIFTGLIQKYPKLVLGFTGNDFEQSEVGVLKPKNERGQAFADELADYESSSNAVGFGRVSEDDLATLTSAAIAYINLSGYEGFGFGPLQAMATGTPAIVSNLGSFPEISGPAALVVNPKQPEQAQTLIKDLLAEPTAMRELAQKGKQHAQKFTWESTFEQTWNVISTYLFKQQ